MSEVVVWHQLRGVSEEDYREIIRLGLDVGTVCKGLERGHKVPIMIGAVEMGVSLEEFVMAPPLHQRPPRRI